MGSVKGVLSDVRRIFSREHPVFARDHGGLRLALSRATPSVTQDRMDWGRGFEAVPEKHRSEGRHQHSTTGEVSTTEEGFEVPGPADRQFETYDTLALAVEDASPPVPSPFEGVAEEPGVPKPDPILVVDEVTRRFGGLVAVDVHHLEIQRGAVTGLIGPNGAGKTTLFNLLTGFDRATSGTWMFDGLPLQRLPSYRIARRGVVRTFQLTKALARMTVIDNMMLGATAQTGERFFSSFVPSMWRQQEREIEARADELLGRFNLTHMRDTFAGELSGGQRKLLEMARALMVQPRLIMLDEPMAGVNPALAETIMRHVGELRDAGLSVVFVEHDMDVVREISDWVVVMSEGRIVAEGRHGSIVANPVVIDAYLGAHHVTPLDRMEQERHLAEAEAAIVEEEAAHD